ncbi:MAG: hypothetical protein Greene07147_804 [Parcubacteria group bacterium Greene0714_7]|nr:MAG: hypothetical protein Greene07147_804 [Parcubacteria group bacterium Greene0714_7]
MKHSVIGFLFASLATVAGYIFSHPLVFGLCIRTYQFSNYIGCADDSIEIVGVPLFIFALFTLPITFILILFPKAFSSWFKFALWWVPFSILVITITPTTSNSWMPLYSFVREDTAWFMGGVFAVISLGIIVWKTTALRKKN